MDNNNTMEYRIGLEKQNKRNDQVTELILDNCRASQISGLTDEFVNLETLSLINVGLTTLKGFPKLPKLKKLELSDNRLTGGLNLLHGSPNLQHLNISGNRIKDFEALEPLKEFHELVSLDLYHCEITKAEDYRKKVFDLLTNLKALDGFDRDENEVADSDEDDDEGSDVENHITRDDNDLEDEEVDDDEDDDDDDDDDNNENDDDLDDDDDDGSYEDEEFDDMEGELNEDSGEDDDDEDLGEEDYAGLNSSGDVSTMANVKSNSNSNSNANANANANANPNATSNDIETHDIVDDDDDVQEIADGDDMGDEDEDDDEDDEEEDAEEEADLKLLQKDSIVDDDDDADFEPTHEADERDHEIDPEDDADEDNEGDESGQLPTSKLGTNEVETRGQKRKLEDEGGDETEGR